MARAGFPQLSEPIPNLFEPKKRSHVPPRKTVTVLPLPLPHSLDPPAAAVRAGAAGAGTIRDYEAPSALVSVCAAARLAPSVAHFLVGTVLTLVGMFV